MPRCSLATPSELIHAIYDRGLQRPLVAGLADVVQQAMLAGDAVAAHILARAAEELVGAAASVVTRLGMRGDVFPTILAGGIFRAIPALSADVCERMAEVAPRSEVRPSRGRARTGRRDLGAGCGARNPVASFLPLTTLDVTIFESAGDASRALARRRSRRVASRSGSRPWPAGWSNAG